MSTRKLSSKCLNCDSEISITYTTRTIIIGWGSQEVWPKPNEFHCPVCGHDLKIESTTSVSGTPSRPPGW